MRRLTTIESLIPVSWRSIELKPTLILLSSAVVLTVYRYYGRRSFFRELLYEHFPVLPFRPLIPFFAWYLLAGIPLFLIPVCLVRYVLREPLRDYGMCVGDARWGLSSVGICYLLMLPVLFLVAQWPSFQAKYPLFRRYYDMDVLAINTRIWVLIAYELAYGCYFIWWEFMFRGFMLYGLEPTFGPHTVFVQTIPFAIMHYGKPFPEAMGAVFTGVLLGFVGLRVRSFWYAALLHWSVALSMDLIALTT